MTSNFQTHPKTFASLITMFAIKNNHLGIDKYIYIMINLFIFTFMYIYIFKLLLALLLELALLLFVLLWLLLLLLLLLYIYTLYTHTPYFKTILRHMTYPHPKDQSDHGKSCFSFSFWQLLEPWGRWRWPPSGSVDPNNGLVPGRSLKPYVFSWLFMLLFPMCFPCFFLCFSMVSPVWR